MVAGRGNGATFMAAVLLLGAPLVHARGQDPAFLCDQAAEQAAATSSVPLQVLLAITRVETGRHSDGALRPWPWSINLAGEGYWFTDATEAMAFANDQLATGRENFDVGCFQINLHWHGAQFASLEEAFDPDANAAYAATFLTELYESEGGWPEAVAAYHSRTPEKAADYLQKVEAILADLGSASPTDAPIYAAAEPRENRFPLLQGGQTAGGASLVPRLNNATPLIGAR